jgi:hypothetical protein
MPYVRAVATGQTLADAAERPIDPALGLARQSVQAFSVSTVNAIVRKLADSLAEFARRRPEQPLPHLIRKRLGNLLITHISECEGRAENNVGQSHHAAPQDGVAGQRISGAGEPAAEPLMIGSPAASNCVRWSAMCRNWASRSGGELRASVRRALTLGE